MKPELRQFKKQHPGLDENFIREHFERLENRYFDRFDPGQIGKHLESLARLSPEEPVDTHFRKTTEGLLECTLLSYNYSFELSIITGILAASDFEILSGNIFTYKPTTSPPAVKPSRRCIIDHFMGKGPDTDFDTWTEQIIQILRETFRLLEKGSPEALIEAKRQVNELVAKSLSNSRLSSLATLYPMHIEANNDSVGCTRLKVLTEDTPFFLFAFSTALSLRNISIEHVEILTREHRVEDEFELVDALTGQKLDPEILNEVKLSLLLTKQFTYFIGNAPDPFTSLTRFESLIEDILKLPQQGRLFDLLSNPKIMEDLAKLLGTSDFLWEDFIRLQYENLLPLLGPVVERKGSLADAENMEVRLNELLDGVESYEDQKEKLNFFKDRESYLIDLDHILKPQYDFRVLSERLTRLAEIIVNKAIELTYRNLSGRFGKPQTVAGLEARFAIFGLGKLGGQALGYASDIEILFIYSDSGNTKSFPDTAESRITNTEFFEFLARDAVGMIKAKREGIFHVDLRLRPFGKDGPLACSLDSFCRYYAKDGAAHSYERLSLVRLRAIGGDPSFGAMIERLRDKMIYDSENIDLKELRDLREKQLAEKTRKGLLNAKYSPGALVDLEYAVQILQIIHGESTPSLRTSSIHKALDSLLELGVISKEEAQQLLFSYHFLRKLINALRMLRGTAQDLFLPPEDSIEFIHLARRIGYVQEADVSPGTALYLDFETATAFIRVFVERHFGKKSLPGSAVGNIADLVLADTISEKLCRRILSRAGFSDPKRAAVNLRGLAGKHKQKDIFAKLAVLACDILESKPDPDMALNNWERFARSIPDPADHFTRLLSQPMRLEILLSIFSVSQFLADTLINNPGFFEWVTQQENIIRVRAEKDMEGDLRDISKEHQNREDWLNAIRTFRRREILRIGTRDLCLGKPIKEVMAELTHLAEAVINVALEVIWTELEENIHLYPFEHNFCILAFGKMGGEELNYSSDVDLLGIYRPLPDVKKLEKYEPQTLYARVMERLRSDLASHTGEGHAYRVDLRLRPYGKSGHLVFSDKTLEQYYRREADMWEIQALLKARPIAGNRDLGMAFIESVSSILTQAYEKNRIWESIKNLREKASRISSLSLPGSINVKEGAGGIRDIEFLIQGLQLSNTYRYPALVCGNTLRALERLEEYRLLPAESASTLRKDYMFLRRVEHYLQIWEDQQIHALPNKPSELNILAKRLMGTQAEVSTLMERISESMQRVVKINKKVSSQE
jgi:glutamate-ammonia-ligase adenylyltransferase